MLTWRMFRRDWRSGEMRLLALALVLAVAAVTAVGFVTDRVGRALTLEAAQWLGGDLLLVSDHPWGQDVRQQALDRGLRLAETQTFPSMVVTSERMHLAEIKAVSEAYPLRGQLRVKRRDGGDEAAASGPAPGSVWLDERLAGELGVSVGDPVTLGRQRYAVSAILSFEPDRGVAFMNVAPRLMFSLSDLAATDLVQAGSRVTYRILLSGEPALIERFRDEMTPRLARGERLEDLQNARPEIRSALERGQRFLGLAAMLTVVLAAVGVSLATRRYLQRHLDACAVMRCLGATPTRVTMLHAGIFGWLAIFSAIAGCALGYAAHFVLYRWLIELIGGALPAPSLRPVAQGVAVAAVLLGGFAMPALLRLGKVSTLRVLRRELGPPAAGLVGSRLTGLIALSGLMLWVAGDWRLGAWSIGGLAGSAIVSLGIARSAVWLLGHVRRRGWFGWRQGLANLERHAWSSSLQIVALALGLLTMLLLSVTRGELLAAWQNATPPDTPNKFIINILDSQVKPLQEEFERSGLTVDPAPMVRGRLLAVNERPVSSGDFANDDRAQRMVEREFNLSWRMDLPPGNQIVSGRWFTPDEAGQPLASVEEGLARTLGIRVGDTLTFKVSGDDIAIRVIGLRKLEWDSMRVNFFVLTPPGVIDRYPASYLLSVHVLPDRESVTRRLVARFPNLTVIDVGGILEQLRRVLAHVADAVQLIFVFTVLMGMVVLAAAQITLFDERRHELAVLRAIGARQRQLRAALLTEMAVIGGLAGLLAGSGALAVGHLLAQQVFQIVMQANLWVVPVSVLVGALLSMGGAWWALRGLLKVPPSLVLREGV